MGKWEAVDGTSSDWFILFEIDRENKDVAKSNCRSGGERAYIQVLNWTAYDLMDFETGSPESAIDLAKQAIRALEAGSIPIKNTRYGVFPYNKKVVFAQPVPSYAWMKLQQSFLNAI